ncbi:hypothetical protein ZEAMMB73_Zm00001d020255 [Zea mays]|uniref:Uncharacterized protein n=1 Tax=Zea mays TaxID=4577 RepID=A0A1D6I388_MAIZE|nr:hypothetical protein ZEAMMB73_Zm00001d020255 [Zea mays]
MILPFQPLTMMFHKINYFVDMPKLLSEGSGVFRPCVLTALVSSNSAGRTIHLDVLAGRKTCGCIEGDIKISGHKNKELLPR